MKLFLESHDPTQGMRQGNDIGTQYRSALYFTSPEQEATAREMIAAYNVELAAKGHRAPVTTEIAPRGDVFLAEDYHQQYLAKNPNGYCGIGGTGVSCPLPPVKAG
jgi:peptide-methionine (S)-S-oxide reductase